MEVFRGLKSESDAEIAENSHFWIGTNSQTTIPIKKAKHEN